VVGTQDVLTPMADAEELVERTPVPSWSCSAARRTG
jgi:hypothetical protein